MAAYSYRGEAWCAPFDKHRNTTPGQAAQLIAALGTICKLAEVDELSDRITALEKHHARS